MKLHGGSLDTLREMGEELAVPAGAFLWREGDRGDSVAVLLDGVLEVLHETGEEEEPVLIRTLEPGTVVGDLACLDGLARSAAVRARTTCRVVQVPAERFRSLVVRRDDLQDDLFWTQVDRVRSLTNQAARDHRRAITDFLTGLYNFGFFRERLALEVDRARQTGDPISLVLFDIDHFKNFNDTNGHQAGNEALVRVAAILKGEGRRGDIVARFGGEEFVILLYGTTRLDAWQMAEGLRQRIEEETFPGEERQPLGKLTVSGGVATFPEDADSDVELIRQSDVRLYEAKGAGRNRVSGKPREA